MVSLQVEFITYDSMCRSSVTAKMVMLQNHFSALLSWHDFFKFPAVILTKFQGGIFIIFPRTVVFQQENEIPVNVQQDSCSNQAIIFVRV